MHETLTLSWWVFLIRGITAILLSVLLWVRPAESLAIIVLFFGIWMLIDGIFASVVAITRRRQNPDWGWMLLSGIMSLLLGALTLHAPAITAVVLALYLAAWALMLGFSQIALGWRIRKEITGEWALYLSGAGALLFGIAVLWNPAVGMFVILRMAALFSLLFGASLVVLSVRWKQAPHHVPQLG